MCCETSGKEFLSLLKWQGESFCWWMCNTIHRCRKQIGSVGESLKRYCTVFTNTKPKYLQEFPERFKVQAECCSRFYAANSPEVESLRVQFCGFLKTLPSRERSVYQS